MSDRGSVARFRGEPLAPKEARDENCAGEKNTAPLVTDRFRLGLLTLSPSRGALGPSRWAIGRMGLMPH